MSQIPAPGGLLCLLLPPTATSHNNPTPPTPGIRGWCVLPLCSQHWYISHPTCTPYFIFTPSPHPGDGFLVSGTVFFHLFHEYSVKCLKHWINTYWKKGTFEFRRWGESRLQIKVFLFWSLEVNHCSQSTDRSRAHCIASVQKDARIPWWLRR